MPEESAQYVWFPAETVRALKGQLEAAGPEAVLIVRGHGKHMTLEVAEPDAKVGDAAGPGALNEAHPCPPLCR